MYIVRLFCRVSLSNNLGLMLVLLLYPLFVVSMVVRTEVMGVGVELGSKLWWRDLASPPPLALGEAGFGPDLVHRGCPLSVMWPSAGASEGLDLSFHALLIRCNGKSRSWGRGDGVLGWARNLQSGSGLGTRRDGRHRGSAGKIRLIWRHVGLPTPPSRPPARGLVRDGGVCAVQEEGGGPVGCCLHDAASLGRSIFVTFLCKLCCKPSTFSCKSGHWECFAYLVRYCQIDCEGAGYGCDFDAPIPEVEYGAADYPAHERLGSVLIPSFSAQPAGRRRMRHCGDANAQMLLMLEALLQGLVVTMLMPILIIHYWRRPCALCLLNLREISEHQVQSSCYTSNSLEVTVHAACTIFMPLGLIRRRRVRASLKSFLRFSGEDFFALSSVMHPLDLQLNPLPQMCLPTRLLVEPLALRLVRLQEAPEEYDCRFFVSEFSLDLPAGSNCVLLCMQRAFSVACLQCVHLGTCYISNPQSSSCKSCAVTMFHL